MQNNNYLDELKLILGLNYEISDSLFTVAELMKMDITDVIANVMELNRKANEEVFLQVRINEIKQKFTTHRIPISKFKILRRLGFVETLIGEVFYLYGPLFFFC